MADPNPVDPQKTNKSPHAEREERILSFWKEKGIFDKSLAQNKGGKEFVFYEGPPTANGRPGIHHVEARAFKDAIPRYKTMRGFSVRRKGGWDTHGLPVELQVEKQLGLKSKKEIETYGIAAFNEKCKESVWTYVHEWEDFTRRIGYWIDLRDPYITYKPSYIESLWNIVKTIDEKGLLYKDYKVVPWCPRCGTALSSHELAQGYADVKDLSVYAKFKLKGQENTYLLAWTTTPWTLPGNAALAIGKDIDYVKIRPKDVNEIYILAQPALMRLFSLQGETLVLGSMKGSDLVGLEYEPLYPFLKDSVTGAEEDAQQGVPAEAKLKNAFKVYAADFVTTSDGTGIVHIAPMYGQDDFELGTKANLPKYHLVNEDGTFKKEVGFLAGKFVKDEEVAVEIIKNLANRPEGSLLFHKEKHEHSYPFCWRCKTPLIYFARDSWYIRMSDLRHKLVKENEDIHWEPAHIKEGRFGEWLREVKDWAISRERYWGTPLPIWSCESCRKRTVVGSIADIAKKPRNTYYVIRHGEADNNVLGVLSGVADAPHHLTEKGRKQVAESAGKLKGIKFDMIFASPFVRTQETLAILRETNGWKDEQIKTDVRIRELGGGHWNGRKIQEYYEYFNNSDRFASHPDGVENYTEIKKRMGDFLYDLENRYESKTILIVTHETPAFLLIAAAAGMDRKQSIELRGRGEFINNAEVRKLDFTVLPHNPEYETDLHRPYIDEVVLPCECGGEMRRAKEVMDVWFDSGSMPFAQDHYPFEAKKKGIMGIFGGEQELAYPADFISEAIDQTRGWFYTLHAVGMLMGKGKAFKNVICLGHILDAQGKKMSKSVGNVIDPWNMIEKYGADALRFWMYSVNQPGDSKNFDEKTVDEIIKKVFNLTANVTTFYKTYADEAGDRKLWIGTHSANVLDLWILSRLNQLIATATSNLDAYVFLEPTRAIRDFVADLSQWYLRRSRDRFKEGGTAQKEALATTYHVLSTLAKIMAPFIPFFAENLYQEIRGSAESVHLEAWPSVGKIDEKVIADMEAVRTIATKGLEARANAKINVRQPLATLSVSKALAQRLGPAFLEIIQDEVNVKEIVLGVSSEKDVELDLALTPELREEGELRELLRKIQDMRKEKGLSVKDTAILSATGDQKDLITKHEQEIRKATNLSAIEFGDTFGLKV
ncbi:MAG: isoleucyl-tRNA synthetase, isoleucyl-tRNA synthetase [Candidatus Parcubacteria bacterium]|nr:isoleucyl-tRNA synthetase, isoleucyl-tRNA synthetase [Candidatus Parcubacteria bacterium]